MHRQRDVQKSCHLKSHLHHLLRRQQLTSDMVYHKRRVRNTRYLIGIKFRTTWLCQELSSEWCKKQHRDIWFDGIRG